MTDREICTNLATLNHIDEIEDQNERFQALLSLAPNLAPACIKRALEVAEKIKNSSKWQEVLIAMAPHFTDELFLEILNNPKRFGDNLMSSGDRRATLMNLSPHIPHDVFKCALQITREINRSNISASVLGNLIPRIEDPMLVLEVISISADLDPRIRTKFNSQLQQKLKQRIDLFPEAEALKLAEDLLLHKSYYAAETLVTLIPCLSSKSSLLKALEIAHIIDDAEGNTSRINALAVLNHDIAESHSKASDNKSLCESYQDTGSNKWKKEITEEFTNHIRWIPDIYSRWIQIEERDAKYIYEKNLAVWRAIGNEAIDRTFCQTPRSKAKVLALLYYYFEGEQQNQIFDELLENY